MVILYALLGLLQLSAPARAAGRDRTSGTTSDAWDRGTFAEPSVNARPKVRYWAPDAYIDDDRIFLDIQQLRQAGMGGFELISYQLYGDPTPEIYGQQVVDWGQYGFGSAAWKDKIGVFASAAAINGLNMDFALGPNQGAGVPVVDHTAPGLSTGLEYGHLNISGGEHFSGALPAPDLDYAGRSSPYYTFGCTSASPATLVAAVAGHITHFEGTDVFLNETTMIDLTASVTNGKINFTVPGKSYDQWILFSFWQRRTGQFESRKGLSNSYPLTSNGSLIVDHFSAAGARLSTQFMDRNAVLDGDFASVSMYAWEDSAELLAPLFWTDNMTQAFIDRRGYSPTTALPLFFTSYSARKFYFDLPDQGQKYVNDYHQTLTDGYLEYLQYFKQWAHNRGFQYSNQPYGLPIDFTAASSIADAPECESLEFADNIDAYRQFAGGVNMAQTRIMSSETGAKYGQSYSYSWPDLLLDVRSNQAGGVNLQVFHGSPYSGNYPNTTWPGYTAFIWEGYSGSHNVRQPAWSMYPAIIDQIARTNFALQNGVSQIDLAIYRHDFNPAIGSIWTDQGLFNAGYTWNYVSPANLYLPTGTVTKGVLAAQGPSFKSLIVNNETSMTPGAAAHLVEYANAGLPIVFIGTIPSSCPGNNVTGDAYVKSAVTSILDKSNVRAVASQADAVTALQRLSVSPFSNTSYLTVHRWNATEQTHYVFFYNQNASSTQNITLQTGEGVPFILETLTGRVSRIAAYSQTASTTSISLSLARNAIALVAIGPTTAFETNSTELATHALINPSFEGNLTYGQHSLIAKSFTCQVSTIVLSNSSVVTVRTPRPQARQILNNWQLTIESWGPLVDIYDATNHSTSYYHYNITALSNWTSIDSNLQHVSGIGYYETTFNWTGSSGDGAILATGPIFHTQSAQLNGQALDAFDLHDPWIDITSNLREGSNTLRIQVATTLQNKLLGLEFNIETSAAQANPPYPSRTGQGQGYGLAGPVVIIPYAMTQIPVD